MRLLSVDVVACKVGIQKAVHASLSNVRRQLLSSFSYPIGHIKVKRALESPSTGSTRLSKWIWTPRPALSMHSLSRKLHGFDVPVFNASFITDTITQSHRPVTVTILSAPCLRLRLSAMIQLGVSNEIIVVVPEVTPDTPDVCCLALRKIHR